MTTGREEKIPMLDLTEEIGEFWEALSGAVLRVLRSGRFVLGPEVEAFEREVAEYLGVQHAIGLNSGTDALVIGLRALGVGSGDEVITTAFSFFATAEAVLSVGATPVFVDVEDESFNIDPALIERSLTGRTKALLPVHLFGRAAAIDEIDSLGRRHGLKVLEDCAQSFGAGVPTDTLSEGGPERKTGAIGHAAAFSFYPTKNLGAYGDGGLLVTDDADVARLARMLRNHGASPERRYENEMTGYNSRLDEIQAAVLRVKLPLVDEWNEARREVANRYIEYLSGVQGLRLPTSTPGHVWHQFTVRVPARLRPLVLEQLQGAGIGHSVFYPKPLHSLLGDGPSLPVSERLAEEVVSLPISPRLTARQQERVAAALAQALEG